MRVLMLGNSLTSSNGLPERIAHLIGGEVVAHTRGGARLAEQLNPATRLGSRTTRSLAEEQWDFVILQEMSTGPARFRDRYLASVESLAEAARSAGAAPVIFATWPFREGSARLAKTGWDFDEMQELLHDAFETAARDNEARLADVGSAFARRRDPSLYAPDGVHPSDAGADLAAGIIAEALLRQ
jgi:hypothetical protein